MKIGKHEIGKQHPCFIIAETGTAHCGDINRAFRLIDAAHDAGADCVKFQLVYADEILHPLSGFVTLPGGRIDLYQRFKDLEQPPEFYKKIKDYTEKKGLFFLCTPFGLKSAALLKKMGVKAMKIASPELNHISLLNTIGSYDIPVILSTGVSLLKDIEQALFLIKKQVILLHCITAYPAPEEEYNLSILPCLEGIFGVPLGISDHSLDPVLVPVMSRIYGACLVEKHFTLSNTGTGLDDVIALVPDEFRRMVDSIRKAENDGYEKTLESLKQIYGTERIELISGDGVKRLAPSERDNYSTSRRSIHALKEIQKGELLCHENMDVFRSEKNLIPGLDPAFLPIITGKRTKRKVPMGQGISWDDII